MTTPRQTLEYDDMDLDDAFFGRYSPSVAGTPLTGTDSFLRINHYRSAGLATEPYRLYATVQPPPALAVPETEANDTQLGLLAAAFT